MDTQSWKYRTSAAPCMSTPLIYHTAIFSPGYKYNVLTWLQCYHLVPMYSPGPSWVQAAAFTWCAIWTRWIGSQFEIVAYSLKCGHWTCYSAAPKKTCRTESGCFAGNKKQTLRCLPVLYAAGIPVQSFHHRSHESGSGNSSVVRTPDSWLNGHRFESLWELSSPGSTVCADSNFGICDRSTPCYQKKIARKRSQSFRQKCRWQVTAKHACTISMWLCKKWHGAWLYGVHRTCRDSNSFMWHQPCQCCKYISTPLGWIFKNTL